jgi:hypothetical protein
VKKDTSVNIRLTSELRAELQRLADADGRKLSAYIERLLQLHVGTEGQIGAAERREDASEALKEHIEETLRTQAAVAQETRRLVAALRKGAEVGRQTPGTAGLDEPPATPYEIEELRRANLHFHQTVEKATQALEKLLEIGETSEEVGEKRVSGTSRKARR